MYKMTRYEEAYEMFKPLLDENRMRKLFDKAKAYNDQQQSKSAPTRIPEDDIDYSEMDEFMKRTNEGIAKAEKMQEILDSFGEDIPEEYKKCEPACHINEQAFGLNMIFGMYLPFVLPMFSEGIPFPSDEYLSIENENKRKSRELIDALSHNSYYKKEIKEYRRYYERLISMGKRVTIHTVRKHMRFMIDLALDKTEFSYSDFRNGLFMDRAYLPDETQPLTRKQIEVLKSSDMIFHRIHMGYKINPNRLSKVVSDMASHTFKED